MKKEETIRHHKLNILHLVFIGSYMFIYLCNVSIGTQCLKEHCSLLVDTLGLHHQGSVDN